jgi:hypothetical protein
MTDDAGNFSNTQDAVSFLFKGVDPGRKPRFASPLGAIKRNFGVKWALSLSQ